MRFGKIGKPLVRDLPYDAEVEYLDSIVPAYIDTNIIPPVGGNIDIDVDGLWLSPGNENLGTMIGGNEDCAGILRYRSDRECDTLGTFWYFIYCNTRSRNTYSIGSKGIYLNGVVVNSDSVWVPSAMGGTGGYTIKIAGYKVGNPKRGGNCRYYSVKITDGNTIVRNFVPVRVGSVGAMYDRANPKVGMNSDGTARNDGLYFNRGTGAFIIGPDKVLSSGGGVQA